MFRSSELSAQVDRPSLKIKKEKRFIVLYSDHYKSLKWKEMAPEWITKICLEKLQRNFMARILITEVRFYVKSSRIS